MIIDKIRCVIRGVLNREIILYLIFGMLTTVVSLASYYIITRFLMSEISDFNILVANVASWVLAVFFAYATNRIFVFDSKSINVVRECFSFFASRLSTLGIEMVTIFILVTVIGMDDRIVKLLTQVINVIGNYFLSKFIVFRKRNDVIGGNGCSTYEE